MIELIRKAVTGRQGSGNIDREVENVVVEFVDQALREERARLLPKRIEARATIERERAELARIGPELQSSEASAAAAVVEARAVLARAEARLAEVKVQTFGATLQPERRLGLAEVYMRETADPQIAGFVGEVEERLAGLSKRLHVEERGFRSWIGDLIPLLYSNAPDVRRHAAALRSAIAAARELELSTDVDVAARLEELRRALPSPHDIATESFTIPSIPAWVWKKGTR